MNMDDNPCSWAILAMIVFFAMVWFVRASMKGLEERKGE